MTVGTLLSRARDKVALCYPSPYARGDELARASRPSIARCTSTRAASAKRAFLPDDDAAAIAAHRAQRMAAHTLETQSADRQIVVR